MHGFDSLSKFLIIFVFLVSCLSFYENTSENFYTRVSIEEDMSFLDMKIIREEGATEQHIERAKHEMMKLPTKLWKQFFLNGGILILTTKTLHDEDGCIVGSFSIENLADIKIVVNVDYIEYSLCHEFSHYLYYVDEIKDFKGYREFLYERDTVWKNLMNSNYYFFSESEYFAEAGKLYFKGEIDPSKYPKTEMFFNTITSKYK